MIRFGDDSFLTSEYNYNTNFPAKIIQETIQIPNFTENIMNYGCWCAHAFNPIGNANFELKYPMDSFDFVCKSYVDCRASTFKPGTNDYSCADYSRPLEDLYYGLDNDDGNSMEGLCLADDDCASSLCQCQLDFVDDLKKVIGMGKTLRDGGLECLSKEMEIDASKDGLCRVKYGSGFNWKEFDSEEEICAGDQIEKI